MTRLRSTAPAAVAVAVATLFSSPAAVSAQTGANRAATAAAPILPFKATEKTLPNGLKVIVVPTGFPNIVSLQIPVQTGSRNEVEPGKSGFAHFFEHIVFKGSPNISKEQASTILTEAGARENAYTTDDFTNYYITFAKEDLETMLHLQADRFQNLAYSEADFKTEARAVLGEYNTSAANPIRRLFEAIRDTAFTVHPYEHTTLGFLRDIEDMPNQYEYSKTFFDRWYRPERTTIIVAGDVDPDEVIRLVEKHWGNWQRGTFSVDIPVEPPPAGPKYGHVTWPTQTLPYVTVAFRNPAFSETVNENAALDLVSTLYFGPTSELSKRLVQREQKVDAFNASNTSNADPELFTILARVKKPEDAAYVRDAILATVAQARSELVSAQRLADAKSNLRYSFVRSLDNTDQIASTLARFVRYSRSYNTVNNAYALYAALTPEDLRNAARKYFTDAGLIVTTLSNQPLDAAIASLPKIASFESVAANGAAAAAAAAAPPAVAPLTARGSAAAAAAIPVVLQKSPLPQIRFKLNFDAGSADDPPGKEGLALVSAGMIANAGSSALTLEQINALLYPMAGGFGSQVDKEMTTFTGTIHRDNWKKYTDIVLPRLLDPGFREEDFRRIKDAALNGLRINLRSNNEEELGKERLQTNIFAGTPYAHPVQGTIAGLESITLDDVRNFVRDAYTRGNLALGVSGDAPDEMIETVRLAVATLPAGTPAVAAASRPKLMGTQPKGMQVEIIEKDTRSTAISFGHPIEVTRTHPDFAALNVARAWLGEHRLSTGRLYWRLREVRGMNYGDYAYIEAFPRGMFQFFPDASIARRGQIFEIWIRPVAPHNAHMALRIATHELDRLVNQGMSEEDFQATRQYLMKNVYVMTQTQDAQLGYGLDSRWYGMPDYTSYMREQLQKLTREDVNRALKKHLSPENLSVVLITKDADGLKNALIADAPSTIVYDGEKPAELLAEDRIIGARKLNIAPENVKITKIEEVYPK